MPNLITQFWSRCGAVCTILLLCAALIAAPAHAHYSETDLAIVGPMQEDVIKSPPPESGYSLPGAWNLANAISGQEALDLIESDSGSIVNVRTIHDHGVVTDFLFEMEHNEFVKTALPDQSSVDRILRSAERNGITIIPVDRLQVEPKPFGTSAFAPFALAILVLGGLILLVNRKRS